MKRWIYLSIFLLLPFVHVSAQTYYQVTALSGSQTVGGNTVTVTTTGTGNTSTTFCGAGPYWIGSGNGLGGYTHSFATATGKLKYEMTGLNNGEVVAFYINGVHYALTTANFTMYTPTCTGAVLATGAINLNGDFTITTGAGSGFSSGVLIEICPGVPITSVSTQFAGGVINGVVYNFFFSSSGCVNLAATADTPCAGGILHLNATYYPGATYSWTGPGGFTSTSASPTINPASTANNGTYTVTMVKDTSTYTATVVVNVRPKPGIPVVTNNGPLCSTGTLQLNANSSGGSTYQWFGPGSYTSTVQNPTITPAVPSVAGTYKVVSTAANGCISDTGSTLVQIFPVAKADFTYNIKYGCTRDTVIFTNTSTNSALYQWSFGDNTFDTAKNPTHIYTTQNIFNVRLVVRSANNCVDSVTKPIDLKHPLQSSFTVSKDSICQQGSVTFTNTSVTTTRNGIAPTYLWNFGDGGTSTAFSPTHNYTRSGIFTTTLTTTDFVPCTSTATHVIVVDSIPFVRFTISDTSICEGQAINFLADYLRIGFTNLIWRMGDSTTIYNRDAVSHGYDGAGQYTVSLTAQYRICAESTYTRVIDVRPFPGINLGPDTAICPNGSPILIFDHVASPASTYLWNNATTGSSIVVNTPGTYWAQVTANGCTTADTIEVRKNCYTNIPNTFTPNGDGLNDYFYPRQLLSGGVVAFKMSIYNRWGQLIYETRNIDGRGWDGRFNDVLQPEGVFIYLIDVAYQNGTSEKYQGNVTLLR